MEAWVGALARIPLDGGGSVLFEVADVGEGPVKVGRLGETIRDLPRTMQESLQSVTQLAQAALLQLRQATPDEVTIEFGVDMAAEAGAVITKTAAGCHLNVTVTWRGSDATNIA
ncbi:CU044_2847 family protein [Streptomyces massasporeus]|uniref:CU044_2847 family protein n=1 Tax=Streptomyces massasporeus TaxID=67324 RepID=UPI003830ACF4